MKILEWFLLSLQKCELRKKPVSWKSRMYNVWKIIRNVALLRIFWIDFGNVILSMFYSDILISSDSKINDRVATQISAGFQGGCVAFNQSWPITSSYTATELEFWTCLLKGTPMFSLERTESVMARRWCSTILYREATNVFASLVPADKLSQIQWGRQNSAREAWNTCIRFDNLGN